MFMDGGELDVKKRARFHDPGCQGAAWRVRASRFTLHMTQTSADCSGNARKFRKTLAALADQEVQRNRCADEHQRGCDNHWNGLGGGAAKHHEASAEEAGEHPDAAQAGDAQAAYEGSSTAA